MPRLCVSCCTQKESESCFPMWLCGVTCHRNQCPVREQERAAERDERHTAERESHTRSGSESVPHRDRLTAATARLCVVKAVLTCPQSHQRELLMAVTSRFPCQVELIEKGVPFQIRVLRTKVDKNPSGRSLDPVASAGSAW